MNKAPEGALFIAEALARQNKNRPRGRFFHSGRALTDRRHLRATLQAIPEGRQQQGAL
jgi:hypothetical protein